MSFRGFGFDHRGIMMDNNSAYYTFLSWPYDSAIGLIILMLKRMLCADSFVTYSS